MRIGSLFSGIGGLELGLETAGVGHTVWQVELDPYCRAVLANHWPEAVRYDDVKAVGSHNLKRVDLICGGFPCQDVSSAGKRAGLAGARSGLWFEYARIVGELRPQWVVVENVASGARAWVDTVRSGLAQLGYASLPIPIEAADVGAPHARARVFIVATNVDSHGQSAFPEHAEMASAPQVATNAQREQLRHESRRRGGAHGPNSPESALNCWRTPEPSMVRVVHGVSRGLDSPSKRIKALGNSVVPQCAEVVGHVILELSRGQ